MTHAGKRIREVMTSDPRSVEPATSVGEAARMLRTEDVGSLPIIERGRIAGMLTDRDIVLRVVAEGRDAESTRVADVASRELVTIDPDQSLEEAARMMSSHQLRRLPVVDEEGRLVGIVAQADLAREASAAETGAVVGKISED
jgi:CBS domain-containing protein